MAETTTIPSTEQTVGKDLFEIRGTHHVELFVGNAKQSAYFYRAGLGFEFFAYAGPETGVRDRVSYALKQGKVVVVLTTPLTKEHSANTFLVHHGDGVRDIALTVASAEEAYTITTARGARGVMEPHIMEDEDGRVVVSAVATYGDTIHTFVERGSYKGAFLPGFKIMPKDTLAQSVGLKHIDHVVGNVDWNEMDATVKFYNEVFGFTRFVSFDDNDISTEFTALKSTVVANETKWIKFPINEPAEGKRRSQIEEYIQFNNGPGVQHVAMETTDIIATVQTLRNRGIEFLQTPDSYYDMLASRVGAIQEDIETLRSLRILVDKDDKGYMLQIFTKPLQDRPTLFFEIIQRRGGESFGKGNFKALFESIEREQALRGTL